MGQRGRKDVMSGPETIPFLPAYIPQDVDMAAVKAEVAAIGVSAPPEALPGLVEVVSQAQHDGINLKIVLIDHNPPNDTPLRDIATVVGADYPDVTVLALSPSYVGSYSKEFPRVTLEAGEDHSKTGNAVQSAQNFLNELDTPEFPWTGLTIFLLIGVLAAAVGTRFTQLRARRSATSPEVAQAVAELADPGV
ncbi:membrane protein [Mycobacterium pseudoshottsii JCM 15466]|nr:membrane protein [Mycobacterium pseudoshottsii JCM 15466]